ncbi:MAG: hypothetical protein HXX10_24420 [Rhodoplanes sp.]|uniref:hypothetical protein n=1 Tax=Rhodoplanes sp. TaxID=1968906 RepID=UPI0017F1AB2C|nr:hypothetical protein [Rhodoplanes sp.]NVO17183.1 hypothetical protein [Rhodoplanes sp.]
MTEPKTIRETAILVGGLDARLGLVQKMVWGIFALLGTLLAGAAALYVQIGDLKTEIAGIKATVAASSDRLGKIEKSLEDLRIEIAQAHRVLSRLDARLSSANIPPRPPVNAPEPPPLVSVPMPPPPSEAPRQNYQASDR